MIKNIFTVLKSLKKIGITGSQVEFPPIHRYTSEYGPTFFWVKIRKKFDYSAISVTFTDN